MNDCVEHLGYFGRNKQNSYAALIKTNILDVTILCSAVSMLN